VNFGSFNTPAKLSPETVDAWARILGAVPGSRLILKGGALGDPGVRARALSHFAARTIDPARVEVLARTPDQRDHLGAYHRLDLALDTYPYCGATTTCEALWMGVPVVTRRGPTHAARVGATLLTAIGLPGLIAESADEFVRLAVSLAADPGRLGALSGSLRERVRASPLCDAAAHGRAFESALRGMWRARCAAPAC
jgi:predicted O-linked N-acetylglucosamine transferase (SPINDLY family)